MHARFTRDLPPFLSHEAASLTFDGSVVASALLLKYMIATLSELQIEDTTFVLMHSILTESSKESAFR